MAIGCASCESQCLSAAVNNELSWRAAMLNVLCGILNGTPADASLAHFQMTSTGIANEEVLAAVPGKIHRVRSLFANTADANADFSFGSRIGGVTTPITPTYDLLNNAGVVLPKNEDGWFQTAAGASLVITSTAAVDVLGTKVIL